MCFVWFLIPVCFGISFGPGFFLIVGYLFYILIGLGLLLKMMVGFPWATEIVLNLGRGYWISSAYFTMFLCGPSMVN